MANLVTFAKKLWKDKVGGNTPITAAELNRIEGGISDCATQINRLGDSVGQVNLNGCKLAVTANQGWFGIYVRGHEMPSFGMEVNEEGAIVRFVKDGKAFKTL